MQQPLEKDFQAAVVRLAKLCGWQVFHQYDSRKSEPGWPDLVLMRPPVILFRELKRALRPQAVTIPQRKTLRMLAQCGQDTAIWTPADWKKIEETLQRRT